VWLILGVPHLRFSAVHQAVRSNLLFAALHKRIFTAILHAEFGIEMTSYYF
jgi:hypothetical protein